MLDFPKESVLLANALLQFGALSLLVRGDIHQRDKSKGRSTIVVFDNVGVDVDNRSFAFRAFNVEGAHKIGSLDNRRAEGAVEAFVVAVTENAPRASFKL